MTMDTNGAVATEVLDEGAYTYNARGPGLPGSATGNTASRFQNVLQPDARGNFLTATSDGSVVVLGGPDPGSYQGELHTGLVSDSNIIISSDGSNVTAQSATTGATVWSRPDPGAEVLALHDGEGAVLREGANVVL